MAREDARNITPGGAIEGFLDGVPLRPVAVPGGVPFQSVGLALGLGASPLEMLVTSSAAPANPTTLRAAWKARNAGRAAPLLFVFLHGDKASLCGPAGEDPPASTRGRSNGSAARRSARPTRTFTTPTQPTAED